MADQSIRAILGNWELGGALQVTILWYFGNSVVEFIWEDIPYPEPWKRFWNLSIYKGPYLAKPHKPFTLWFNRNNFSQGSLPAGTLCFFFLFFGFKWRIRH